VRLSGVNSINWARLVAQAVYYFTAAVALGAPHRKIAFTVPTGNFGDVYAGYVASKMGLPVDRLVVATNVNDILARTFDTGDYETRGVVATSSPSMDIQVSSNFERLLYETCGRDPAKVSALMGSLAQSGRFTVPGEALKQMRALLSADRADEQEVDAEIRAWMKEASYCVDPHTAVALAVAEKETRDPAIPMVVLSTAHPAKFPDAVKAACGVSPALPDWLSDLPQKAERFTVLPADQAKIEEFVAGASRAAREGAGV
jgi:threonine synthase